MSKPIPNATAINAATEQEHGRGNRSGRPGGSLPDQLFDKQEFFYVHVISTFVNVK